MLFVLLYLAAANVVANKTVPKESVSCLEEVAALREEVMGIKQVMEGNKRQRRLLVPGI